MSSQELFGDPLTPTHKVFGRLGEDEFPFVKKRPQVQGGPPTSYKWSYFTPISGRN